MVLHYFWMYIGGFIACSIALGTVVRQFSSGFAEAGKKPYLLGILASLFVSILTYLATFLTSDPFQLFWIIGGVFLLFGIAYILFFQKNYFYAHKYNSNKVFTGAVLFGLALVFLSAAAFSALQYFVKDDTDFLFYPVLISTLLFFIPLLLLHTFDAAYTIPPAVYRTWHYPLHQPIDLPDEDPNERLLVIGFEIAKKAKGSERTYFRAKAPETMKLGELFYHFVNDYNDLHSETTIEYADDDFVPHEWWFRKKPKWYQFHKILNPDYSIRENGITENTVIICERTEATTQHYTYA